MDFTLDLQVTPIGSSPLLFGSHFTAGAFTFGVCNVPSGKTNYVQTSTDLQAGNWVTVSTNVPSTNAFDFTALEAGNSPQQFFRVVQLP